MIALLVVAVLVIIYDFAGSGSSSAAPPASSIPSSTAASKKTTQVAEDNSLDPRFRTDILAASQNKKYEAGRNIFQMEEVKVDKTIADVRQRAPMGPEAPPTPTPTPPPPPIPLKFYGFANKANEPKRVFLAHDDEVFVAKQGDIVERKYKVVQINNASVVIEDMLYNNRQPIPLTAR